MNYKIAVIKGDGIGPEIVEAAMKVLDKVGQNYGHQFDYTNVLAGGCAIDACGTPLPQETVDICKGSDAVLLGAMGGPKWDNLPGNQRPEAGLLGIRKALGLFANLRPAMLFEELKDASPLKPEIIGGGLDVLTVRELTGDVYFDVLETSRLWRTIVTEVAANYPMVEVEYLYVDNAAMQLVINPQQFDVILTGNLFGDILSDESSMLTGSIGMLPSASLGEGSFGMYEPIYGSAPDIAGEDKANPMATVLSAAMMLRYSFGLEKEAQAIETAVKETLAQGYRTGDIATEGETIVSGSAMCEKILENLN